jgi:hypothetical protein
MNEFKEVVKELMPYLEKAGEFLGTTAQQLWVLQVKQAYITGVSYILAWILYVLVTCFIWKNINKVWERFNFNNEGMICTGIIMGIITILFFFSLPSPKEILTIFINPEYWALGQVIKLLKGSI